jgi:hypothetical protein
VLHWCTKHEQRQQYEKYFLCNPRPQFQPKHTPEQDKMVSKRVEIMQINACTIIPFITLAELVVLVHIRNGVMSVCSVKGGCSLRDLLAITFN